MKRINFSKSDIDNIIKMRTIDKVKIKSIAKHFGCSESVIGRLLDANGVKRINTRKIEFDDATKERIINAYESGIGANGIPEFLGLDVSCCPVIAFLKSKFGKLRNRSEQQFARMARSTPEEIANLTRAAHEAVRGRVATVEEREARAKTVEGKLDPKSKYEPVVFDFLVNNGFNCFPGKAVGIYNVDIMVNGNIAVEVFGGQWSVTDKLRVDRYVKRTKYLLERGIKTVFVMIGNGGFAHGDNLVSAINFASSNPPSTSEYWMVWGNADFLITSGADINNEAFVKPSINVRDPATGRYVSVPK